MPVKRGCGSRKAGGVYLECGLAPGGSPVELFLFDPPHTKVEADWLKPHRNPILFETHGVWNVVIWVGAQYWPNVWDWIEEVRVAGSSRRVSASFDFSKLTSSSRQFFVHANASFMVGTDPSTPANASWGIDCHCPRADQPLMTQPPHSMLTFNGPIEPVEGVSCLGLAKSLHDDTPEGYAYDYHPARETDDRVLPCGHKYETFWRQRSDQVVLVPGPAVFMALPLTGVAMIRKDDGTFDPKVKARVEKAGVETFEADQ